MEELPADGQPRPPARGIVTSIDFDEEDLRAQKYALHQGAHVQTVDGIHALRVGGDGPYATIPVNISPDVMPACSLAVWVKLNSIPNRRGWLLGQEQTGYDRTILMHDDRFGGAVASAIGRVRHGRSCAGPAARTYTHARIHTHSPTHAHAARCERLQPLIGQSVAG